MLIPGLLVTSHYSHIVLFSFPPLQLYANVSVTWLFSRGHYICDQISGFAT